MQDVTLAIGIVISLLAVILPPAYALAVYIIALLWYPNYLVVSIGTIDITVGRFVVGALLLRCVFDGRIRSKFVWMHLDTLVALSMVVYVLTICLVEPLSESVENRAGFLMDSWFAYVVTRYIITDITELLTVIKWIGVALVPLAVLGMIESVTGWSPFALVCGSSLYFNYVTHYETRWGLNRGVGPFSHSILFGCVFAMFLPLIYYLRYDMEEKWRFGAYIISAAAIVGVLSSMSSAPMVMLVVAIFCLMIEKHKYVVKPLLLFLLFSCLIVSVVSNRPLYHVIVSYINPLGGSGWHRAKLIDLFIKYFDKWWLVGYGDKDPGWGPELGMGKTDITNEFVLAGVKYGLIGLLAFCTVLITTFRGILSSYKNTAAPYLKSLYWAFGCAFVSIIVTWMSVSFFGQLIPLYYGMLGMMVSSFRFVEYTAAGKARLSGNRNGSLANTSFPSDNVRLVHFGWRRY
jgi:hypothetical protein